MAARSGLSLLARFYTLLSCDMTGIVCQIDNCGRLCVKFSKKGRRLCQCFSTDVACQNLDPRSGPSVSNCPKKGRHPCQILGRPAARVKVPAAPGALCQILPPCVKVSNFSRPRGPYYPRIDILDHVARTTHRQRLKSLNQSPSYALRQDGSVVSRDKRV